MGKREFLSSLFLGLFVAAPVFLPTSPALAQDCTDPDGAEGSFGYHTDYGVFMGCTATGWVAWHPATRTPPTCEDESPPPGTVCSDGTVYAGNSPIAGTPKMFVTPCDVGMVWNGTECTGTRTLLAWNDANSSGWTDVAGITNCSSPGSDSCLSVDGGDGRSFTTVLKDADANTAGGFQPHRAARYCYCLGKGTGDARCTTDPTGGAESFGYSDWYLPSFAELNVLYTHHAAIQNFLTDPSTPPWSVYWSSSEYVNAGSWLQQFSGGAQFYGNKSSSFAVRCARR